MQRNVYLIGPMGVGKTTIGRALAKNLRMDFYDSDQEIEARTGVSIATIFDIEGEAGFRRRETEMIKELAAKRNIVLATGGGAILAEENRRALRANGLIVYLHASVGMQIERTRGGKNRPLLDNDNPGDTLASLMEFREPIYRREADVIADTDQSTPAVVARNLVREINAKWEW